MQVLTPGYTYEVAGYEGGPQFIQFLHKAQLEIGDPMETVSEGTTNEEVLEVLIDRMNFLQSRMPCRENAIVITKLEEALLWLNRRTQNRLARGVEGTEQP